MNNLYGEMLKRVELEIAELKLPAAPSNLYDPVSYIMGLGGKRIRPILTLLGCKLYSGDYEQAVKKALAIEVFHNFTLVHDDIMDSADVRRGLPTVHKKWSHNIALLSGDAMLVLAYQMLLESDTNQTNNRLATIFSSTAMEVCEGQQMDMDYAQRSTVEMEAYLDMIRKKTAVLLAGSIEIGAIIGGAKDAGRLRTFAEAVGLAFQVKDDYLDAFGTDDFGKAKGGDIVEGKRTWLTVKSYEIANDAQRKQLDEAFGLDNDQNRVDAVMELYEELEIDRLAQAEVVKYSDLAVSCIASIEGDEDAKTTLLWLVDQLVGRTT